MQEEKQYMIPGGSVILEYLQSKGIEIPSPCGGHGTCGKCKIRILAGSVPAGESDKALLTDSELREGVRLACKARTISPVRINVVPGHGDMKILGEKCDPKVIKYNTTHKYGIAIDLGTTTLAAALVDMTENKTEAVHTCVNRQKAFGADVMTRMEAAASGRAEDLKRLIERDLLDLTESFGVPQEIDISNIVIAGNTCMYHLLTESDVSGLSRYPFTPVTLGGETLSRDAVFSYETQRRNILSPTCAVTTVKGFSAFVGGDITSGLFTLGADGLTESFFFIDIGTNAEMVLKKGNELFVASAAAGPALEGGNLSCGTAGVAGAVSKAWLSDDKRGINIETIDGAPPIGICGTGAIEVVSELLDAGVLNKYGTFIEEYLEKGFLLARAPSGEKIELTQEDVRQIQMAKSAIRAGAEILMENAGVKPCELDRVYVSGGFGTFLNLKKAIRIGLLPVEFEGKAQTLGNTSLKGATKLLSKEILDGVLSDKLHVTGSDLAGDKRFNDRYIEYMNFDN